jgi:hypothetical protein
MNIKHILTLAAIAGIGIGVVGATVIHAQDRDKASSNTFMR